MSTRIFAFPLIKSIRRLSFCLIMLVTISPNTFIPHPHILRREMPTSLSLASSDPTLSGWNRIFQVIKAKETHAESNWVPNNIQYINPFLLQEQWNELVRLDPTNPTSMMAFGYSVAIDGDTVVVGAYWHHNPVIGGGAAYVFVKPQAGWPAVTQAAELLASDSGFHDRFGWSVAISGNTIVVGAYNDNNSGKTANGSAYVFVRPDGGWTDMTETAKLTASDTQDTDEFGRSVAISGDTIAVGVPNDDVGANVNQGSVYVYTKPASGWLTTTETARMNSSDGVAGDLFGHSVAISGNTIVAGAYGHNNGHGLASGEGYVFNQSGGWTSGTENARLTPVESFNHDYFGWSVAVDGDLVVVGSPGDYSWDFPGTPAAFVFIKPVGGWSGDLTEQATLTASDGVFSDDFGVSVDVSGDYIVVGAPRDDIGSQIDQGSAYAFTKPVSGWSNTTETDKVMANDGVGGDNFGNVVAISGSTIIIGTPENDITGTNDDIGSAYIFDTQTVEMKLTYLPFIIH